MAVPVLLMTPVRSFGELIQQALQETGLYRVVLVNDIDQVREAVRTNEYPVAVLDFDLEAAPADLVETLYELDSNIRIIAIKDETESSSPPLGELRLAQHLNTPFYLPDLLDALEIVAADLQHFTDATTRNGPPRAFASSFFDSKKTPIQAESPEWLDDTSLAAIHLTRLSLESSAQAALITRNAQLWAYAGHLPHPAAEELAQFVGRYWYRDGGSDFARFIRLDAVSGEYILYATGLGGDYVLALAFDTGIPFTNIRSQAKGLASQLADDPEVEIPSDEFIESGSMDFESDLDSNEETTPVIADENLEDIAEDMIAFPTDWRPDQGIVDSREAFFEDLLSSVDIPEPDGAPSKSDASQMDDQADFTGGNSQTAVGNTDSSNSAKAHEVASDITEKVRAWDDPSSESKESIVPDAASGELLEAAGETMVDDTRPVRHPSISENAEGIGGDQNESTPNYLIETLPTPMPDYLRDTIPTPTRGFSRKYQVGRPVEQDSKKSKSVYSQLTYACVLVPKLPQHHLVGDRAAFISRCIIQVSKAFGWQLEHLSIRPNYLHWVIAIPPGTSPGYMVRIMRDHASHRIFNQFPALAQENQTGDFWASGYLIVNRKYPLSHQLVEDFIGKVRVRQSQPHNHSLTDI